MIEMILCIKRRKFTQSFSTINTGLKIKEKLGIHALTQQQSTVHPPYILHKNLLRNF